MTVASTDVQELVQSIGYPTKRDDAWRYAPHGELGRLTFGPGGSTAVSTATGVSASVSTATEAVDGQIPKIDGPRIVLINGTVDQDRSDLSALPDGVLFSGLATAADGGDASLSDLLGHDAEGPQDAYLALNTAYGSDGAVIRVAEDVTVDAVLHIVDVVLPGGDHNASSARMLIDMAPGSSATVVETRIGGNGEFGASNIRTNIALAAGATLEHIVLQDLAPTQIQLGRVDVTQAERSELRARCFNLGGRYGRFAYHVMLAGEGAHAELSGLYFGLGDQTLDQQITVIHGAKDCTSRQSFRGVLDDESTGVFNGGIDVRPGADGTDAEQANDNLLLSRQAEANTQPRLEILADDVACKHGATIGQLDEMALYYMRSRGIPAEQARRLLVNGFADQVMDEVEQEVIRTWVAERLGHTDA